MIRQIAGTFSSHCHYGSPAKRIGRTGNNCWDYRKSSFWINPIVNKAMAVMVGIFVDGLAMAEALVVAEGIAVPAPHHLAGVVGDRPRAVQLVA